MARQKKGRTFFIHFSEQEPIILILLLAINKNIPDTTTKTEKETIKELAKDNTINIYQQSLPFMVALFYISLYHIIRASYTE